MESLFNKHILLGVTGSIAAYKSAELVRRLREAGADVRVVMTTAATEFVAPLTFQALSGHVVHQHLLDEDAEAGMGHIELARWADAVLVAPASADFIARLGQGRADDLLTAVCLASQVPLALAPAMNRHMWVNPATQANVRLLSGRGILLFGPDQGLQACGDSGPGRMLQPEELLMTLAEVFKPGSLSGRTVMVTAGPTREAIDPVRFLSNHSSGKMGYSIAAAAAEAGARVILISGPVSLATPPHVERIDVISSQEMLEATLKNIAGVDIFVGTAAVADYRPRQVAEAKIKKSAEDLHLELERTPDILATVKARFPGLYCVGFAAETSDRDAHARAKLRAKGVDMIAANWVGPAAVDTDGGFGSDNNALHLFWPEGEMELPVAAKAKLARQLIAIITERYNNKQAETLVHSPKVVSLKKTGKPPPA